MPSSVDGSSARQALARRDSGARDDAPASRRAGAKPYARSGAASMRRGAAGAAGALALTRVARASAAAAADRVAAASAPPTVVLGVAPSLSGACPPANTILVHAAHAGTLAGEVAGAARRSGTARGSPADASGSPPSAQGASPLRRGSTATSEPTDRQGTDATRRVSGHDATCRLRRAGIKALGSTLVPHLDPKVPHLDELSAFDSHGSADTVPSLVS